MPRGDSEKVQPGNLEKQAVVMRGGQWAGDSREHGLRLYASNARDRVPYLVQENPMCHGATKPMCCNY